MRAGYLAALASRTLGTVPTLRPVTPSRFEPTAPQPGLHEVVEMVEVVEAADARGTGGQNAPRSSSAAPGQPALAGDDDRPLVGQLPATRESRHVVTPDQVGQRSRPEPRDDELGPADLPVRPDWQPTEVSDLVRAAAPDDARVPTEAPATLSGPGQTMVTRTVRPLGRDATRRAGEIPRGHIADGHRGGRGRPAVADGRGPDRASGRSSGANGPGASSGTCAAP